MARFSYTVQDSKGETSSGAVEQLGVQVHMLNREVNLFKL